MSVDKSKVPRQGKILLQQPSSSSIFINLDLRVLKKNMVYCSGIPSNLTEDELTS